MLLAPQLCGVVQVELVSCRTVAHYSRVILIRLQIDIFHAVCISNMGVPYLYLYCTRLCVFCPRRAYA